MKLLNLSLLPEFISILAKKDAEGIASFHNLIFVKNKTPQLFLDKSFIVKFVVTEFVNPSLADPSKSEDLLSS